MKYKVNSSHLMNGSLEQLTGYFWSTVNFAMRNATLLPLSELV